MSLTRVRRALDEQGLLLVTDPVLPSITSLVAGEPVRGSRWSHPAAHAIFAVVDRLEDDPSSLFVTLVSGKRTLVHPDLWRHFFSIATSRQRWQLRGLSASARARLRRVESRGELRPQKGAATELERRLLAHGRNVHTPSGAHAKLLRSWPVCMGELRFRLQPQDPEAAKRVFEEVIDRFKVELGKTGKLPWPTT